jgi:hypothetical protein
LGGSVTPTLTGTLRAMQAMGMRNTTRQKRRWERSPEQEYLIVNGQSEKRRGHLHIARGGPTGEAPRFRSGTQIGRSSLRTIREEEGCLH